MTSGVAQGLVLRPASFHSFVGDVESRNETPSENFVITPNCLMQSHTRVKGRIQRDLDSLERWFCVCLMKFNKAGAKCLGANPSTNAGWLEKGLRVAVEKRCSGCFWRKSSV